MNTKHLDKYLPNRNWLGAIRSIIKHKFLNGETVRWGTNELLRGDLSVNTLEDIAQDIAESTLKEHREQLLKRNITDHFTIGYDADSTEHIECVNSNKGTIYYNNKEFGRFWRGDSSDPYWPNRYVFNAGSPCLVMEYSDPLDCYTTIQEMLVNLENTFPHEKYEQYLFTKG